MPQLDFFIFFDEAFTTFIFFFFYYYIFSFFFIPLLFKAKFYLNFVNKVLFLKTFFFSNLFVSMSQTAYKTQFVKIFK